MIPALWTKLYIYSRILKIKLVFKLKYVFTVFWALCRHLLTYFLWCSTVSVRVLIPLSSFYRCRNWSLESSGNLSQPTLVVSGRVRTTLSTFIAHVHIINYRDSVSNNISLSLDCKLFMFVSPEASHRILAPSRNSASFMIHKYEWKNR